MAEFSSPISGGIRVARNTVSSSVFSVSRPAAPTVQQPDPTTINLLTRNQLALTSMSTQLTGMAQQMRDFGESLQRVSVSIANDSALEQQRQIQKQNQERQLAEQQIREGKESQIEKKIQSALISPVQKVASKTQGILSRLMLFFTTILTGWLANQGIETLRALSKSNTEKLENIKNNVIKNVAIIGGAYAAIRFGLFGLISTSARVISKISGALIGGLFVNPIRALIDAVKNAASKVKIPSLGTAARAASSGAGAVTTGAVSTALNVMSGKPVDEAVAAGTGAAVATTGTAAAVSKLPLPGPLKVATMIGAPLLTYGLGEEFGVKALNYGKSLFGGNPSDKNKQQLSNAKTAPSTPKTPPAKSLKLGDGETTQDFSEKPKYGEVSVSITENKDQSKLENNNAQSNIQTPSTSASTTFPDYSSIFSSTTSAKVEPVKSESAIEKANAVGPLPEPKPNIVVAPTPPAQQNVPMTQYGRSANNVPYISASNPDNFYTLYSQMSYNVVT